MILQIERTIEFMVCAVQANCGRATDARQYVLQ
ncbi:hypothetical protein X732_01205 [Mesorhizobium sp. L2C066B000]|nr:hypothetical protein X732_01205 [Mesorhizobium sp. L2C066B000]ESZ53293.1 hypothetical protein X731_02040 [Mesorhizobium sp. L2C054A000]